MTTSLILALSAFLIFIAYNAIMIWKFGMPSSLSDTFYLLQNKKKGLGYLFTAMMTSMAFTLMPGWLSISDAIGGWESNLTFLAFFACAGILFVGCAPAFRNIGIENKVHMISAKLCAVFAMLWCAIVCWRLIFIIPLSIGAAWAIGYALRNHTNEGREWKHCSDYIWELAAFLATFITVITQCLLML